MKGNPTTLAKPTGVDKSIGKNKASRSAKLAARRGLQTSNQPTPMEIEKEVYRQQRNRNSKRTSMGGGGGTEAVGGATTTTTLNPTRRNRRKKVNISSMMTERGGKKNSPTTTTTANAAGGGKNIPKPSGPPPRKAVQAAVQAMSKAGYQVCIIYTSFHSLYLIILIFLKK